MVLPKLSGMVYSSHMDRDTRDLLEALNFIKERMATKSDLEDFATKEDLKQFATKEDLKQLATKEDLARLKYELDGKIEHLATKNDLAQLHRSLTRELDDIREQLKNVGGFSKEIDHALERIAAIEKHLGIEHKIAA